MILQCAVLLAFLAAGELTVYLTNIPIPSSIIGMLFLTLSLKAGIVREEWVNRISDFMVKNLGFFFIPAGVGVMKCFSLIREEWIPIVGASVISTFVIIAVTGQIHQITRKLTSTSRENELYRE